MLMKACSHIIVIRRRFWQDGRRHNTSTAVIHVREVEGQGGCHESYEDGAGTQEGADQGEIMRT